MPAGTRHSSLIPLYRQLIVSTLLAVIALLIYFVLPERRERILPDRAEKYHLFFDSESGGKTTAEWVDERRLSFKCIAAVDGIAQPYCGLSINLAKAVEGKDYSKYERMEVKINYKGDNRLLRLRMNNFNPTHPKSGNRETLKGLDVIFLTEETRQPLAIHNHGWIASENSEVNNNIVYIGIDVVPPMAVGEHYIHVQYMDLYGELLPPGTWYLGVALIWLMSNVLFIARHLIVQERRIRNDAKRLSTLAHFSNNLQQQSQRYKLLSNTDPLTGALNRNGFAAEMSQRVANGKMIRNTTMMVIDLDHFKRINDSHGHDAGDAVLRETTQIIHKNTRATDLFVRWGGEEFILFCEGVDSQQAIALAEKIRVSVEAMKMRYREDIIPVTVSIGIAIAEPQESFDDLFHRADQALYRAKHRGRNCITLSESEH
jgi:diguanylate cyclase (GGDEF)-like protein